MESEQKRAVVVDPTELQLQSWGKVGVEDLQPSDLSTPEGVNARWLIYTHLVTLTQLKAAQVDVSTLRAENANLVEEKANLREKIASRGSDARFTALEIPVSIFTGFAIEMLAENAKDAFGWIMLIVGIVGLLLIRGQDVLSIFVRGNQK